MLRGIGCCGTGALLRPTRPLLMVSSATIGAGAKEQMKKNMSGFGVVDPDRQALFDSMQTGLAKKTIEARAREKAAFRELPAEEQIRRFMVEKRKFDVDLIRKNGMNVKSEFELYTRNVRKNDKAATRAFWIPIIVSTAVIFGGTGWWVLFWY